MKTKITLAAAVMSLTLGVGAASAFPLFGGSSTDAGTQFEDNNYDFFTDNDQNGLISVGDVLTAAVEFENIVDIYWGNGVNPTYDLDKDKDELVALSVIKLLAVDSSGTMYFGQDGDTPMVQFYTGGPTNLDVLLGDPTLGQAVAAVQDGTFLWSFSIDPTDPDTFWSFTPLLSGAANPAIVNATSSVTKVGVANYALNQVGGDDIFQAFYNLDVDGAGPGDGFVDLAGSGDILGGRGLTGAFARSDIDVAVNPVPEPATIGLLGLGLMGLAAASRRKSSKA